LAESYRQRRLRQIEELLRQLQAVMDDLQEEQRELRKQLGLPEKGDESCPQP
jgi:hypothetical protein